LLRLPVQDGDEMDTNAAHEIANELVQRHGLAGWTVEFDRAKRRAGVCQHGRQQIGLSDPPWSDGAV